MYGYNMIGCIQSRNFRTTANKFNFKDNILVLLEFQKCQLVTQLNFKGFNFHSMTGMMFFKNHIQNYPL